MSKLPKGWKLVNVEEVVSEVKDKINPDDQDEYLYVGLEHIESNGGLLGFGSSKGLKSTKTVFRKGDLLYGKLRPYLNKHFVAHEDGICSTDIIVFRSRTLESVSYLNYYLSHPNFISWANSESKGINLPRLSPKVLGKHKIPLPPLNEQKRIVAKLDLLFAHLDGLNARLERVPELLKQFRQSVLTQAVTGKLTEDWREGNPFYLDNNISKSIGESKYRSIKEIRIPDNWAWASFDSVAEVKSNLVNPKDYRNSFLIAPDNIEARTGKLLSKPLVSDIAPKSAKHYFEEGSIVYSKIRPYLSKLIIADFNGLCSADMYPIGVKDALRIKYLYFYMLSDIYLEFANSAGSRSVLPKINQKELAIIPISVPPIKEQQEIVRRIEALFEKADLIEQQYELLKEKIEHLPQAILAKAFRGELVPQDPNDEPAEKLLQNIQPPKSNGSVKQEPVAKASAVKNGQASVSKKNSGEQMKLEL